jgi:hypothetical protein
MIRSRSAASNNTNVTIRASRPTDAASQAGVDLRRPCGNNVSVSALLTKRVWEGRGAVSPIRG